MAMAELSSERDRIGLKRADLFREQCYIDGKWTGDPSHAVHNPATRGLLGRIPNLGRAETRVPISCANGTI
jgi:succinate-semialdehyde dehydrogenase/glutarate-semialdehyde dehydrogenase